MHGRRTREVVVCATGVVLLLFLSTVGCGRTQAVPEGELRVHNERGSCGTIHAIEVEEVVGPNFLAYDVWALPGDTVVIDVYPSLYDVTVYWTDGGRGTWFDVEVVACCTTTVDVLRRP